MILDIQQKKEKVMTEKRAATYQHFPAGSTWRRWDIHVHAPGTALNDQFQDDWDAYLDCIANASPKVSVLGITDYMSTRCYESVLTRKDDPRLANVDLLFPNIEFRITPWTKKNKAINLHILLSPDADDHLVKAHEALARLTIKYKDREVSA